MYIEKRWLVPAGLSLLLLSALFAVMLLLLASKFTPGGLVRPARITSVAPQPTGPRAVTGVASLADPAPEVVAPTDLPAPQTAVAASQPARTAPEEIVRIATSGSGATQINTRGFGDIGLQLQDVNINGPVTMVHISNQGNNNTTDVNLGNNDRIASDQRRLQSNRSDGTAPPVAVSTGAATPRTANAQPAAASAASGRSHSAAARQRPGR